MYENQSKFYETKLTDASYLASAVASYVDLLLYLLKNFLIVD
jgi:hypothetical protein